MSDYKWIHPPLLIVEDIDETLPTELQITQDDLNQTEVPIYSFDVPEEDRKMYADELFDDMEGDAEALEEGEDVEPVEYVVGFFLSGDASGYSTDGRNTLTDPQPQDIFVYSTGYEREAPSVYAPIGQHSDGSHHPGDYLISIEDYLAISAGIYTPAVYTCQVVRDWDPHKMLRPKKETETA